MSVSVSGDGERVPSSAPGTDAQSSCSIGAACGSLQRLELEPAGVPRQVSLDGNGKDLAVQVSRDGRWGVDVIRLP